MAISGLKPIYFFSANILILNILFALLFLGGGGSIVFICFLFCGLVLFYFCGLVLGQLHFVTHELQLLLKQ